MGRPAEEKIFTKFMFVKMFGALVVLAALNYLLLDDTLSLSLLEYMLLSAVFCFSIGYVLMNYHFGMITLVVGFILSMMYTSLLPKIDVIRPDESRDERLAIFYITKTPSDGIDALTPTKSFIYNKSGKTLYLMEEPDQSTPIPNHSFVRGNWENLK